MKFQNHLTVTALVLLIFSISMPAQSIKIGNQEWMSKNLDVALFNNGDPIPEAKTDEEWEAAGENKQPAWCWYSNDPSLGDKYGRIYNWYAINDSRGVAPIGWHVPSDDDWTVMINNLGGDKVAGNLMKSIEGWYENGNGSNVSGFCAIPGGFRNPHGSFYVEGKGVYWWSSGKAISNTVWYRFLYYSDGNVNRYSSNKKSGFYVRLIKD